MSDDTNIVELHPETKMQKFGRWVKENKGTLITYGVLYTGCFMVGWKLGGWAFDKGYGKGEMEGINTLLREGLVQWTDGMPVIEKGTGRVISGDPNWYGPEKMLIIGNGKARKV